MFMEAISFVNSHNFSFRFALACEMEDRFMPFSTLQTEVDHCPTVASCHQTRLCAKLNYGMKLSILEMVAIGDDDRVEVMK